MQCNCEGSWRIEHRKVALMAAAEAYNSPEGRPASSIEQDVLQIAKAFERYIGTGR